MHWILVGAAAVVLFIVVRVIRGLSDVHALARTGRTERLAQLLANDPALISKTDAEGEPPLHHAVKYGELEAAKLLLERGSDVNAKTPRGVTALHYAAAEG